MQILSKVPHSCQDAVPAAAFTCAYLLYLLQRHISISRIPDAIKISPEIYLSAADVSPPRSIGPGQIYLSVVGDGAYISASQRRLQRYIVIVAASDSRYAELGGKIVTTALHRKARVESESPPRLMEGGNRYSVEVRGYITTLLKGSEFLY